MKRKTFTAIIIFALLASMGTGAWAATALQEIRAHLNPEIKVKVDGEMVDLRDSNGNPLSPILYQGTNYYSIRAISDSLGVAVDYDQDTKTIILGEKVDGTAITKNFNSMYHSKDPAHTTYKDKDYKEVYFDNHTGNRNSGISLHPKKEYQKLYLQIAAVGEDIEDFQIKDTDNDIILKQVEVIKAEDGLVTIETDIGGVSSLYISMRAKSGSAVFIPLTTSYYK